MTATPRKANKMGARKEGESFEDYRKRLKREAKELKKRLKGQVVWPSSVIINAGDKHNPKLEKHIIAGTYKKAKPEEMATAEKIMGDLENEEDSV